jgi:quercetin dioxygenase-like cupin family protein
MNIIKNIPFSSEKPAVHMVRKTDTINYIAVGLLMDQILPEHKTGVPTILTVLSGAIEFCIEDKEYLLYPFDTFQIPVNIMHEVRGIEKENVFTLVQEKK